MTPVRSDLAAVQPLYYPFFEHSKFGSIEAMCRRHGWPKAEQQQYVDLASLNQSDLVVCDKIVLGDPEDKVCAVLVLKPGGALVLCMGLFAEASEDRAAVEAFASELASDPDLRGRLVAIGEFRPNSVGAPQ
jgi:hypothetical protein